MDLDLSPEHALLRDTIRDFMLTEVAPVIEAHERERRFPVEIVRRIGELGWLGIPIPEDEGGAGLDPLVDAVADEQNQTYLVPMASGRVLGAYGLTEPGAGSDAGGTRTTARLEGGGGDPET